VTKNRRGLRRIKARPSAVLNLKNAKLQGCKQKGLEFSAETVILRVI
jgi:hypothetical protein